MTVQVTNSPPDTNATHSDDPATGAPQVPAGPDSLQAQDVLPEGRLEPVFEPAQIAFEPTEEEVLFAQQNGETNEQQNGTPPTEESDNDDDSLERGLAPGAGGDLGGGAQSSGSSLAAVTFFDDGYGNTFGVSPTGDIVLISGPGFDLPGFDPNLLSLLNGGPNGPLPGLAPFVPLTVLPLTSLGGTNGYIFKGIDEDDLSGASVSSAGDVNGDGFDDLIIGAREADQAAGYEGESYLVFGGAANLAALDLADGTTDGMIELANLDGTAGFTFKGIDFGDLSGQSVSSAGDVNGDGFEDLIIGAGYADRSGRPRDNEGESYLVFGGAAKLAALDLADGTSDGMIELSSLDGTTGFILKGIDPGDLSGRSVASAGDINGDGFDDLIIGARDADQGTGKIRAGESYLVFGGAAKLAALDLADGTSDGMIDLANLDGTAGFTFKGIDQLDRAGASVSSAGDVNGDGFDDLIIGANGANQSAFDEGESYLVFGGAANLAALDGADGTADGMIELVNLDGTAGFILKGIDQSDYSGISVSSAGDVNGDGFDDLIIGARSGDQSGGPNGNEGESYLVFGGAANLAALDAADGAVDGMIELTNLDGTAGFTFKGIDLRDSSGFSVASAGDVNGDGFDDLIVGALYADQGAGNEGESYLVFGGAANLAALDLADGAADGMIELTNLGTGGVLLTGIDGGDESGSSVSAAGDVNGDGFDDLMVGARRADANGNSSGESYLIYGGDFTGSVEILADGGSQNLAGDANANVIIAGRGDDTVNGNGGADVINTGEGDDVIVVPDLAFALIDGGRGKDTLKLDPTVAPLALDLSALPQNQELQSIEVIDLTGGHSLTARKLDVIDLLGSEGANVLKVLGDGTSTVTLPDGWIFQGTVADPHGGPLTFQKLIHGSGPVTVLVQTGVTVKANFPASALDGGNGYIFKGVDEGDESGISVASAGDVNDDGFDDLIIGGYEADPNGNESGESYLVFGDQANLAALDLADGTADGMIELVNLDGTSGYIFKGIDAGDYSGESVSSAGDVNGDGFEDLIIGAHDASPNGIDSGESYLLFGGTANLQALDLADGTADGMIELARLDGTSGYTFKGIDPDDTSGRSVSSAGDVNGDGFDDLIISSPFAGQSGSTFDAKGESYLVFGGVANLQALDLADGATDGMIELANLDATTGYVFKGIGPGDFSGESVSSAGDVNGDGFDDLIIGAEDADQSGGFDREGESYLVFGGAANLQSLDLADGTADGMIELARLDGTSGYTFKGIDRGDFSGGSVRSAGDVNGDGFDDLIIGADRAGSLAGESYLVLGGAANLAALDGADGTTDGMIELANLDGTSGYVFKGIDRSDHSGDSVSSAGDVNGDGFDDLIIGAVNANPGGNTYAGESYVVFGGANLVALDALDGADGMIALANIGAGSGLLIEGIDRFDFSGNSVSAAGDVNGDGFDDLLVGAVGASPNGDRSGETYLIYGGDFTGSVEILADGGTQTLAGDANANVINAGRGDDTVDGNGGADVINAGEGDDVIVVPDLVFTLIDGGRGKDTLLLDPTVAPLALDLSALPLAQQLQSLEVIDLTGGHSLTARKLNIIDILGSEGANVLKVLGDGTSQVTLPDGWGFHGTVPDPHGGPLTFQKFVHGSGPVTVLVQDGVPVDPTFQLATLDGGNGYIFKGIDERDFSGISVSSAGDVDGDGFDDLIIGAEAADHGAGRSRAGESYLVFGGAANLAALDLADGEADGMIELANLDGPEGFILKGIDSDDFLGGAVSSAGDVNGDGFDDLIIGAHGADRDAARNGEGEINLVFGGAANLAALDSADGTADGMIEVANLDGTAGYVFKGIDRSDLAGRSVSSAGDVDGDGFDDLIIGADFADRGTRFEGESYLIFGGASNLAALDLADGTSDGMIELANLDGAAGFIFRGIDEFDFSGSSVSSAGDVNGDGFDDLIIGASGADQAAGSEGESYLLFGGAANLAALDLADGASDGIVELTNLDGTNGYIFKGIDAFDYSGRSVSSAGDVNGDGFDDLIIGASGGDQSGGIIDDEGESYLVFGGPANLVALDQADGTIDSMIELTNLDGTAGFVFKGIDGVDLSGRSVASAGDVNGDGFDDLIVGAYLADQGAGDSREGESYVVFGGAANLAALDLADGTSDGMIELANLGTGGLLLTGIDAGDFSGRPVSAAGDVNGDGFDDLLVGAHRADPNGDDSGETYLIYGGDFSGAVEILAGGGGQALAGDANANVINAGNGDDTVIGNGGADVLNGGAGDDRLEVTDDSFFRVDGGGGEDLLAFALAGARDFGSFDRTAIQNVEGLDFTNGGIDTVTLGLDDVLALAVRNSDFQGEAGLDNVLSITGEVGDKVNLAAADGWTNAGAGPGAASVFTLFTVDAITVAIENDIEPVIA